MAGIAITALSCLTARDAFRRGVAREPSGLAIGTGHTATHEATAEGHAIASKSSPRGGRGGSSGAGAAMWCPRGAEDQEPEEGEGATVPTPPDANQPHGPILDGAMETPISLRSRSFLVCLGPRRLLTGHGPRLMAPVSSPATPRLAVYL